MAILEQAKTEDLEIEQARELIKGLTWPAEVVGFDIEPYTDWSGDASLQITIRVTSDDNVGNAEMDRLLNFINDIRVILRKHGIERFPYANLEHAA